MTEKPKGATVAIRTPEEIQAFALMKRSLVYQIGMLGEWQIRPAAFVMNFSLHVVLSLIARGAIFLYTNKKT